MAFAHHKGPSRRIAKPVPSNVVQKLYDLIQEEEAPPMQLKEFATQVQIFSAASDTLHNYLGTASDTFDNYLGTASDTLDNYLKSLEICPNDDVGTLKGIIVDCELSTQRCQILLMNFFVEFNTFAGRLERVINSQFYRSWEIDTVREIEIMKRLTTAINMHVSPSSEIPATELVLKGRRPAQPAQIGSVGIFFNCCVDLFSALTRETCFLNQLQEKHRLAFREIFGKFHFGGTGSLAEKGELDKILNVSARLKDQTISLLVQIAKILCSKETGFFHIIDEAAIDRTLSDRHQRLLSLLDSFESNAYQNGDSDTDSLISGDDAFFSTETALDDLATFVGCLTKLGFSLDRPAPDPAPAPDEFRDIPRGNQEHLAYNRHLTDSQNYKLVQLLKPTRHNEERISGSIEEETFIRRDLYREMTKLFDPIIKLHRRILGIGRPDTAIGLIYLAESFTRAGLHGYAQRIYKWALRFQRSVSGDEHPDTLRSMNGLAESYCKFGNPQDAKDVFERILKLRKRLLGEEHPDTLHSMRDLGISCFELKLDRKATYLHEKTLELRKRILGDEHPDTLQSMHDLARFYSKLEEKQKATQLHEKTLELRKLILGDEHPDTLQSMHDLGISYGKIGRDREAKKLLRYVVEVERRKRDRERERMPTDSVKG